MKEFDSFLYRGPKISANELHVGSVECTLNLESGSQVLGDDNPLDEMMQCQKFGIIVYPLPLGGIIPPSIAELKSAVNFLVSRRSMPVVTYVHCKHGHERTGIVVAAYRILIQGWGWKRAAAECFEMGMHRAYFPWLIQLWRLDR